jgi:hypothetical protein
VRFFVMRMLIRDCSVDQQIATDLPPKVYERPME